MKLTNSWLSALLGIYLAFCVNIAIVQGADKGIEKVAAIIMLFVKSPIE
jgi:SNF family Na+-dependent transporter